MQRKIPLLTGILSVYLLSMPVLQANSPSAEDSYLGTGMTRLQFEYYLDNLYIGGLNKPEIDTILRAIYEISADGTYFLDDDRALAQSFEWINSLTSDELATMVGENSEYSTLIIQQTLQQKSLEGISSCWKQIPYNAQTVYMDVAYNGEVSFKGMNIYNGDFGESLDIRPVPDEPLLTWYVEQFDKTLKGAKYTNYFKDISKQDWYYNYVMDLYVNNLVGGYGDYIFAPQEEATRSQVIMILERLSHLGVSETLPLFDAEIASAEFSDIDVDSWYAGAVGWAIRSGVIEGFPDEEFEPNAPVTREQLVAMLYRFSGKPQSLGGGISTFADADQITWAKDAMDWAVNIGIIQGEQNNLNPKGNITRAEICAIISRYITLI
ncbi:MAG: hypothetical protein ATN36_04630 [Epulopiscium sp. Nele67-Bin005]|nr:MAG: hypothetical protein ATN36_04630 [Epulopiscium sp. Nele67-Bin005]